MVSGNTYIDSTFSFHNYWCLGPDTWFASGGFYPVLCRMLGRIATFCLPDVKTAIPTLWWLKLSPKYTKGPDLLLKDSVLCLTYFALLFISIFAFCFFGGQGLMNPKPASNSLCSFKHPWTFARLNFYLQSTRIRVLCHRSSAKGTRGFVHSTKKELILSIVNTVSSTVLGFPSLLLTILRDLPQLPYELSV